MYRIIGADGREYGPITADQLRQWIREGRINAYSKIRQEGATEWKAALEFSEFAGVRAMIEKYPLEKVKEAYERMMSGKAQFRVVLTM